MVSTALTLAQPSRVAFKIWIDSVSRTFSSSPFIETLQSTYESGSEYAHISARDVKTTS